MPDRPQVIAIGIPWYREGDYAEILGIMEDAHLLPRFFGEWHELAQTTESELRAAGFRVVRVIVDPGEFPVWCAARNLDVDAQARMAFANECVHREGRD